MHGPAQRRQVGADCGDLVEEIGVGPQCEPGQFLVAVVEDIQHRDEPAGGDISQPGSVSSGPPLATSGWHMTPSQSTSTDGDCPL